MSARPGTWMEKATTNAGRPRTAGAKPRRPPYSRSLLQVQRPPERRQQMSRDMGQEIEIKLAIEPQLASRVWQALSRFPHEKPSVHRLFSAYYDTPDCLLKRNNIALRLRRDGQRWVQTVKSAGNASGGLHRRVEHETGVAVQLPSFPAMTQAGFGELIANRRTRAALDVIFTTKFSRSSTLFERNGGNIVEVSLDRGIICAGQRRESICEIELELKAGNAAAMFEL